MYKKAGIVVAIILIVVAIAIYFIASAAMNSDKEPDLDHVASQTSSQQVQPPATAAPVVAPPATQTAATTTQAQPVEAQPTQTQPADTQPVQNPPADTQSTAAYTEPVQTPPAQPQQGTVVLTEVSQLTNNYVDAEDIGTVVGRKMYVQNNQVIFSVLINTTTHGQIEYYGDLYDYNIADGTRVTCQLRTYQTASSSFVAIISIAA